MVPGLHPARMDHLPSVWLRCVEEVHRGIALTLVLRCLFVGQQQHDRIRPVVVEWMGHLAGDPECRGDTAFSDLLSLVRTKLLVVDIGVVEDSSWFSRTGPEVSIVDSADDVNGRPSRATA